MKTLSWTERTNFRQTNALQQRIALLNEKGFIWREIAELTDLPKKLIKGIAKGEYLPNEEESARLYDVLDNTISRLENGAQNNNASPSTEHDIGFEGYRSFKIEVKGVSIYKGTDDDKMIIKIDGVQILD